MSELLAELSRKARRLTVEERAQLGQELLESVARDVDPDVQTAWEEEISARVARYESGEADLVPAEEVFAAAHRLTR
ncbi:addiction module protein [Piscinibacter sakaiensis]|uniref:addiction module protein n=1 Tax=Piscinibacter sakaiensis TaxID=1547922 RepID=UPI003AAF3283